MPTQQECDRRRGNERQRGYVKKLRNIMALFKQSHPLCLGCSAVGLVEPTTVTDHIIPARGDHVLLWDEANFQPACRWHHDSIKQQLERMFAEGKATVADLRLDSPRAVEMTRRQGSHIGLDGWPLS
jgi:5-methylcytosine-specific restriction endonuclease McrA